MQRKVSIVIICKNEAASIERTLRSVQGVADDIVVYDSGSTDGTVALVRSSGIAVHQGPWLGFGPTRRAATGLARNNWVFCLDADEELSLELAERLLFFQPADGTAWRVQLRNHLGNRYIRWGGWGNDFRLRLFNRTECNWSEDAIHERVVPGPDIAVATFPGAVIHRTAASLADFRAKLDGYARLTAESYYRRGKRSTALRRIFSPLLTFFKGYILKAGFLEGAAGFGLARAAAGYTRKKYMWLRKLWKEASSR